MNPKFVYCIECEESAEIRLDPVWGEIHPVCTPIYDDARNIVGTDQEICYFPSGYTFCHPPKNEDWIDSVVEQGSDELENDLESFEPEYEFDELDDENVPSGDFFMTPTQYVGL